MAKPAHQRRRPSATPPQDPPSSLPNSPSAVPPNPATNAPRPPFFTEVVRAEICSVLAAGCLFRDAARYVGCTIRAIAELIRCDPEFARQIDRALVNRKLILISHIRKAAENSWKASAWLLAHTVGGRYGEHVPTLAEELAADESEQFAAATAELQRPASEPDARFGPYEPLPNSQVKTPRETADTQPPEVASANVASASVATQKVDSTATTPSNSTTSQEEPLSLFEIPGFGKLVPAQATASNPINPNDPLATVKRVPPTAAAPTATPTATPASPTTRPAPTPAPAFPSGKVSPARIRESMRAIDDYLKS